MNEPINHTANEAGYAAPARLLHWLMAAGFVFMWASGFSMTELVEEDGPLEELLYTLHMSTGFALFLLLLARIAVRRMFPPPPPVAGLEQWEERASHAAHIALYALPLMVIMVGWVEVDMGGHRMPFYGLFSWQVLPDVEYVGGYELAEVMEEIHKWLAYGMLCLALIHAGAVAKHRWVDHNDVFHRMSPLRK